jgi:hypothetical protein
MGTERRGHRPRESFDITDSDLVTIELLSGFLSLSHPDEIGAYVTAWEHLFSIAVRGKAAHALVKDAIAVLDERPMATTQAGRYLREAERAVVPVPASPSGAVGPCSQTRREVLTSTVPRDEN